MRILCLFVIADSVWKWIRRRGPGLILLGLADSAPFVSAPPGSTDVLVILLSARHHESWAFYAFMATVGEVLGGYLAYSLAEKAARRPWKEKLGKRTQKNSTTNSRNTVSGRYSPELSCRLRSLLLPF